MRKTPERFKALSGVYKYVSLVQLHEKALALHGILYCYSFIRVSVET